MKTKDLTFCSYCLGIFLIIALFDSVGFVGIFLFHAYFIVVAFFSPYMHWTLTLILILLFFGRLSFGLWQLNQILQLDSRIYLGGLMWTIHAFLVARRTIKKKKIYERVGKLK